MLRMLLLFLCALAYSREQVTGGSSTAVLGGSAILPCRLTLTLEKDATLEQISWQRRTKGKPQTDNFMTITAAGPHWVNGNGNGKFQVIGKFTDKNGTLQLDNVTLNDEGTYTCIFSVFPTGSFPIEVPLKVLVFPNVNVRGYQPLLGDKEVPLAACLAAGAKPAAKVHWITETLEQNMTQITDVISNPDDTQTTTVTLYGRPTREINDRLVQCVVSNEALMGNTILKYIIQVHFSPEEVKITKVSEYSFECGTKANPNASFTWSRYGQPLPSSVRVDDAILQLSKGAADLSGLYLCEAGNDYGRKTSFLYVDFSPGSSNSWTAFGVLLTLNFIAAVIGGVWYLKKSGKFPSCSMFHSGGQAAPVSTSGSPDQPEAGVPLRSPDRQVEDNPDVPADAYGDLI